MRYIVRKSLVHLVGTIWLPAITCAQTQTLDRFDVDNCRDESGQITRASVESWLLTHAGDFQAVQDFSASIEDGENTVEIPWATEEGEMAFLDCTAEPEMEPA